MQRSNVRTGALPTLLFTLAALTACGGDDPMEPVGGGGGGGGGGGTPVITTSVNVGNGETSFDPSSIQVSPGAVVTWTWTDTNTHNVTFTDASIADIGNHSSGAYTATMPTAPGDYAYSCTNHPGMTGTVRVQ